MRVLLQHRSRYVYPRPALLGPQLVRLRPADHVRARIESYALTIAPTHRLHWQRDPHGNRIARITFAAGQQVAALELTVELAIEIQPVNPFDFFVDDRCRTVPFAYPEPLGHELGPCLDTGDPAYRLGRAATAFLATLPTRGDSIDVLSAMVAAVHARIAYVIRDEPGVWTPEETLGHGRGSCRDVATLLVALLRARGIAARFASGYLVQLADEGMIPDAPRGVAHDVVDLHAWAEAFVPGAGWIGLDATSGLFTGEGHIPLACTASPAGAAPLDGTSDVAASAVEFSTTITRLGHEVRPTAPYTDAVWDALLAGGDRADAALIAAGLAVTTGGEPTFTARDDQAADEWQGGALGDDKWRRGQQLAATLRDRLAPGGVIVYRQGKHYPGESLPRWALDVIGASDRSVLWPALAAAPASPTKIDDAAARRFAEQLARELELDAAALHAAFEDPWEILRTEAGVPPELDPRRAGLDDPDARRRLAAILDRGATRVAGWVLPLARATDANADTWRTERWKFRRAELFLLPGDSPIGLRLPLLGLVPGAPAPAPTEIVVQPDPRRGDDDDAAAAKAPPAGIRTALCIEPRDGALWVFLPPVADAAEFRALLAAIVRARAATAIDVRLEGYAPPSSPALQRFAVTPDPGVLEVNLPPVATARAAAALHAIVFDAALGAGLTADRYLLDGRAAGSGGGNHLTIGGASPATSPWLARPDLLASLLTFVQHHPSLSYLFTGLFVGPTSQAPRVDEARHDALYELELALPRLFETPAPPTWQIDALLRHLLVDVAGSTHRAEISIDKLFDPQTPHGRQGLVELRAFEMPPHPRMAAAPVVLVRALLAAFAAAPYRHPLVRWGSALHDRFLLPAWLWRDFEDVLAHLATADLALPADAFRAFVELRCPVVGHLEAAGGAFELRNAIEPWPVLGEEATAGGTSRYVDSSMERLEVRALGLDPERFAIAVNGFEIPMRALDSRTGRDVRVGGVRFRAWCPPHAMHPQFGIHHPLKFDVVDRWAARAVAGGVYHVWHPEGRAFASPPLTRVEAAARRAQRFTLDGPSPQPIELRAIAPHPEQPYTLDLRRADRGHPMPDPPEPEAGGEHEVAP